MYKYNHKLCAIFPLTTGVIYAIIYTVQGGTHKGKPLDSKDPPSGYMDGQHQYKTQSYVHIQRGWYIRTQIPT